MVLTATSGYIFNYEMTALYLEQVTDDDSVIGFGIVSRPQPDNSRDDYEYGYDQYGSVKYNDSGGTGMLRSNTLAFDDAVTGLLGSGDSADTSWSTEIILDEKTNGLQVVPSNTGLDLRVDTGVLLSHYTGTVTTYTAGIDAIQFRRRPDKTRTDYIETTGVHHDTPSTYEWTPFNENESCSSFIMKEVATNNTLTVNFQSAESRTYPVFRVQS